MEGKRKLNVCNAVSLEDSLTADETAPWGHVLARYEVGSNDSRGD